MKLYTVLEADNIGTDIQVVCTKKYLEDAQAALETALQKVLDTANTAPVEYNLTDAGYSCVFENGDIFYGKIGQIEFDPREDGLASLMKSTLEAPDSKERCEVFHEVFEKECYLDTEYPQKAGADMMQAVIDGDADAFCIAATGWSVRSLMEKSHLVRDEHHGFHRDPVEARFGVHYRDGVKEEQPCLVDPRTNRVYGFVRIRYLGKDDGNVKYLLLDGRRYKVVSKEELAEGDAITFWHE